MFQSIVKHFSNFAILCTNAHGKKWRSLWYDMIIIFRLIIHFMRTVNVRGLSNAKARNLNIATKKTESISFR